MQRTHTVITAATLAFALAAAGCSSTNAVTPSGGAQAVTSVLTLPVAGYVTAAASGIHVWGKAPGTIQVLPVLASGKKFIGQGGPVVTATSSDPSRLRVEPGTFYGAFVLSPVTVYEKGTTCPSCRLVQPGKVSIDVTVAAGNGNSKAFATTVAVTIAHKIVAVALNPLPNPSVGGSDAVLQYYDDNAKPSVIWDDIVLKNISSIPNVTGVAYGADGTLYVSNSGVSGVSNGTVTEYPAPSLDPVPAKTLASLNVKSAAGVAVDANGNVYVADNGFETVSRFPAKSGKAVTIRPGWSAGADVNGVAIDTQGHLYVAMTDVGNYQPKGKNRNVGTLAVLSATFDAGSTPTASIQSTASNGVNQPYGVATGTGGRLFVVNDYVSIVQGPPGPGPIYSTLTRYGDGLASAKSLPEASTSHALAWPLAVAADLAGTVYVANDTPPSASGQPGSYYLMEYSDGFASGSTAVTVLDLSAGVPATYTQYYMNVQGVAVYPTLTSK